jgi:hypothetical protein
MSGKDELPKGEPKGAQKARISRERAAAAKARKEAAGMIDGKGRPRARGKPRGAGGGRMTKGS